MYTFHPFQDEDVFGGAREIGNGEKLIAKSPRKTSGKAANLTQMTCVKSSLATSTWPKQQSCLESKSSPSAWLRRWFWWVNESGGLSQEPSVAWG